jgi:hypothetical protein
MNATENKMIDLLIDLKRNHHAVGLKGNMESTGMQTWELMRLKEVAMRSDLKLTIKLGGAEAITDMREARSIGADRVAAPMTSCEFALRKFTAAVDLVYPPEEKKSTEFIFYIETINSYNNLDAMLQIPNAKDLHGLVIGREDLVWSMGMTGTDDDYNSEKVFEVTRTRWPKRKPRASRPPSAEAPPTSGISGYLKGCQTDYWITSRPRWCASSARRRSTTRMRA